ncbi:MAG: AbrB/MazE/SpoVT family DNA-binding domain-containing protein [Bacillota bacterium]
MSLNQTESRDKMKERLSIRKNGQVSLPKAFLEKFNLNEGDYLELVEEKGEIRLVPLKVDSNSQKWFWKEEWQKAEEEADQEIKNGQVKTFDNVEEGLDWLDSDSSKNWAYSEDDE